MIITKKDIVKIHRITDIPVKKIEKALQFHTGEEEQVDNFQEASEAYNKASVDSPEETASLIRIAVLIA
jgi:hypothetical protein